MTAKKKYQPLEAMVYPRFEGIRTFMRLPYVTDLDGVDFAIAACLTTATESRLMKFPAFHTKKQQTQ